MKNEKFIIFNLNRGFLGDKLLHEPIIRWLKSRNNCSNLICIEWARDPISFMEFQKIPDFSFVLHEGIHLKSTYISSFKNWLDNLKLMGYNFTSFETKDSKTIIDNEELYSCFNKIDLWYILYKFYEKKIYPTFYFDTPKTLNSVISNLISVYKKFIVIHIRFLSRDSEKNLNPLKYIEISNEIVRKLHLPVMLIGDKPSSSCSKKINPIVFDLRGKIRTIAELATLVKHSSVFIGGDSGPIHLAAALNKQIIAVEQNELSANMNYGPFTNNEKIIRLTKLASECHNILNALNNFSIPDKRNKLVSNRGIPKSLSFDIELLFNNSIKNNINSNSYISNCFVTLSNGQGNEFAVNYYNKALSAMNPAAFYIPVRLNDLQKSVPMLKKLSIDGYSVSQPFKEDILKYCEVIDTDCRSIGSANTIINKRGAWYSYNTDWIAAIDILKMSTSLMKKKAMVFGTGGVAKAIIYGLLKNQCEVIVCGRSEKRLEQIKERFDVETLKVNTLKANNKKTDIFINATNLGIITNSNLELFDNIVPKNVSILFDVVFDLDDTVLKYVSTLRTTNYIHGKEMLLKQADYQIDYFLKNIKK